MTILAAMTGFQWMMGLVLFAICVLLMLIILIQKGRGGGLAAAFGGAGGGGGAFGTKTGDYFTWITVVLAGVFLLLTVFGNYVFRPQAVAMAPPTVQSTPAAPSPARPAANPGAQGNANRTPIRIPAQPNQAPAGQAQPSAASDTGAAQQETTPPNAQGNQEPGAQ